MELANYFPVSPNTTVAGCVNNGDASDGVVFPGIETMQGEYCFVGRASIIEAAAALFGISPDEVIQRLSDEDKARAENKRLRAENKDLKAQVARWDAFAEGAREAGLFPAAVVE